jgi:pilus assembly protein CpaE
MKQKTVVLIGRDTELLARLEQLVLGELKGFMALPLNDYPGRDDLTELASRRPRLVILEVGERPEQALSVVNECSRRLPGIPVMAVLSENDPELILRCLRSGASEFLLEPVTPEQLKGAFDRVLQLRLGAGAEGGHVYCVIPAKGASGATTLAVNLPVWIRRNGHERVLLSDMDPTTGAISFHLKVKSPYSFVNAVTRDDLDAEIWKGLICTHDGVDVLLAPDAPGDVSNMVGELERLVDHCRQTYEIVVFDTGNAYSDWTLELAQLSDEILLVTTNELTSLRAAQRVLSHLMRQRVDRGKIKLIVNRYNTEIGLNQEAIETALHCDVFHMIPSDYESVQSALVAGKPVAGSTQLGKSLAQLAERLAGKKEPPSSKSKSPAKTSGMTGLFSSLLSKVTSHR